MKALLVVSNVLLDFAWIWTSLAVLLFGGTVYLWRQGKIQSVIWASLRRLPGIAAVVEAWEVIQFCNSMGHLLAGRVSVLDAIQLSGESISNEHLQKKLVSTCDLIRQGESLGRALSAVDVFPKLVVQMVAVGEKSAHLARAMEEISKLYTRRMRESIRKTLSVLEPAVIAVMGIVVGFIIISLLTAIISVNDIPL
jgi:general secretion pathway protein F